MFIQIVIGKFYIYDWADEFNDVWPPANSQLSEKSGYNHVSISITHSIYMKKRYTVIFKIKPLYMKGFRENFGAGKVLDSDVGLFQTWQFSLYKNVMARLRVSEHRTRNPEEATAFSKFCFEV